MKLENQIFQINVKEGEIENLMKIARDIRPLICRIADNIFRSYTAELMANPTDYIVPAVWGGKKDGELAPSQKEIKQKIPSVIIEIAQLFEFRELSRAQAFAIGYLVRELIISKVIYMTELLKKQSIIEYGSEDPLSGILNRVEPVGTA